ncbi:YkvA family protein [Amycolatopsis sp. NPDC001319]|uniref:YkvA family protein n=1 Tax=unclassified Amycolatopsis TaxID=2618356 RepID=UPI0036C86A40
MGDRPDVTGPAAQGPVRAGVDCTPGEDAACCWLHARRRHPRSRRARAPPGQPDELELVDHWRRCLDNNASCLALPIDPIPGVISVLGYADDAIVVTAVLRAVVRRAGLDTVGAAGRAPTTASTSSMLSWGSAVPGGGGRSLQPMEPTPEATAVGDQYLLWRRSLLERVVAFISALDFAVHLNQD